METSTHYLESLHSLLSWCSPICRRRKHLQRNSVQVYILSLVFSEAMLSCRPPAPNSEIVGAPLPLTFPSLCTPPHPVWSLEEAGLVLARFRTLTAHTAHVGNHSASVSPTSLHCQTMRLLLFTLPLLISFWQAGKLVIRVFSFMAA